MRRSVWILVAIVLFVGGVSASAKTPDGKTPSVETVCDNEQGAAFGLCNAYCEAKDCGDPNQTSTNRSCNNLREHFEELTGRPMPCDVSCPCSGMVELFGQITSGAVHVNQCIDFGFLLFVETVTGDFVTVDNGPPAACSANHELPSIPLTDTERLVCRVSLRRAVESQGLTCRPPE